jgi:hypothetical protein
MSRFAKVLLLHASLALFLLMNAAKADFALVSEKAPRPIVLAEDADPQTAGLAKKLAGYLKKITGAEFHVQRGSASPAIRLVVVPASKLPTEAYGWKVSDEGIAIEASSARGLAYGIYAFLERECGCHWWSFNEEQVPSNPQLTIANKTFEHLPPFKMHDLFNREAQTPENDFRFKSQGDSLLQFTGGHNLYSLVNAYGKTHPEIYPMDAKGKRAPNDLHLCYLAPGLAEAVTAALEVEVQRRKGNVADYIYFAGMGDWYGGQCQCEKCRAVYAAEAWTNPDGKVLPGYTGTLLRMINATAEQLEKQYPGIQVGTFAYMSIEAPPAVTKPRENVVIRVPRLRHCTVHAANECEGNRGFALNLRRWQELAPGRVHVWDYGANFTNFLLPFPTLNSMAENIKFYHELSIAGVMIQGNYVSTGGDAAVLKNYVWRTLLQDPSRSVSELTAEFCQGYYGPAAPEVLAYVNALENSVRLPALKHADEFAAPAKAYLNEALLVELRGHLQQALDATRGEANATFRRRVLELQASIEAAVLWKPGPLENRAGQLVRTDLGGDSIERALALVEHSRNASPKERGAGRLYREQFLQMHGGPTATLQSPDITLTAAPWQAGKLGPITFQGAVVIDQTTLQPAGGATLYKFVEQPTNRKLSMRGECGIKHWQTTTQHLAVVNATLPATGPIAIEASLQRVNRGAATASVAISTTYPVAAKSGVEVGWQNAQGDWATVQLTAQSPTATCGDLTALKLKRPAKLKTGMAFVEAVDSYTSTDSNRPARFNCTLTFDAAKKQLVTNVQTEVVEISADAPRPYLKRTLSIIPAM